MAAWGALGLATVAGVLSLLPFGLGATDLVLAAMLTSLGVPAAAAGAIAFGYRLVSTLPLGLLGTASYAWLSARLPAGGTRAVIDAVPVDLADDRPQAASVTASGLIAAAVVLLAIGGSVALVLPAVRRTGLGIVHPAIAWLALHAVFFGAGAAILAATGAIDPGAAWYVAGAALAMASACSARTGSLAAVAPVRRRRTAAVDSGTHDPAPVRPGRRRSSCWAWRSRRWPRGSSRPACRSSRTTRRVPAASSPGSSCSRSASPCRRRRSSP